MISIDFREPLTAEDPCGPDLEMEGDADFLNFMAMSEGLLPKVFFVRNPKEPEGDSKPFNLKDEARGGFDVAQQFKTIALLSERTRDLRLIVLAAKLTILGRDLEQFVSLVGSMADLLATYWDTVNPKGEEGDFTMRFVAVQSLDDNVPVVFPIMYTPLFEDRRFGSISYRTVLLANGEVNAREEDEEKLDLAMARRILDELETDVLTARRAQFQTLSESLNRIREIFVEKAGYETAPSFDKLGEIVRNIFSYLDSAIAKRDPGLGLIEAVTASGDINQTAVASASSGGAIVSLADAANALTAIANYYELKEPSNPALLLVRQAKDLVGKPFLDVLRILVPGYIDEAKIKIGRTLTFDLAVERLADFNSASQFDTVTEKNFEAATREQVLQLLSQVASFFQSAEPTSPIPLLLDRARAMAVRDFMNLLKEILPEHTFKLIE